VPDRTHETIWPECSCNSPFPLVHAIWCPVFWHMKALDEADEKGKRDAQPHA